jgi:hypothetical protein
MRWYLPTECENDDALLRVAGRVARAFPRLGRISQGGIVRCDVHMRSD